MAVRARLAPPKGIRVDWPWHKAKTSSLSVSLMLSGDRRMEAENYLASGYGTRIAIEAKTGGWARLEEYIRVFHRRLPKFKCYPLQPSWLSEHAGITVDCRTRSSHLRAASRISFMYE